MALFGRSAPEVGANDHPGSTERPKEQTMAKDREDMQYRGGGDLNALLGRGSEFEGKLTFEGTVRIDGKFSGEISTNDVLVIGEGAKVQAEISAGSVVVNGEVSGNIKAKTSIELHNPARVKGNLETPQLSIDKGVLFEGTSKMEGFDKAAQKPQPVPVQQAPRPV
jgi:cytoskeletal protein CcmA (bactofilin family)